MTELSLKEAAAVDQASSAGSVIGAATRTVAENVAELLKMLDQRDRTTTELAGRVGSYQAQVQQLQAALEAPRQSLTRVKDPDVEPTSIEMAPESTATAGATSQASKSLWSRLAAWFGG